LFQCSSPPPVSTSEKIWVADANLFTTPYEVTIGEFRNFIKANNYTTTADSLKWSGVFNHINRKWDAVDFANWEKPTGQKVFDDNFPVTQVSYFDACAYCEWKKGRLPSAKEWDAIAGDKILPGNIWQGAFPFEDTGEDGFAYTSAPVGKFEPTELGIHDLFGNVWEWTTSIDPTGQMIIKGGSFLCDRNYCSGYYPSKYQQTPKDSGLNHLGFRCVFEKK
jgi:sulfatase modifying factor 1